MATNSSLADTLQKMLNDRKMHAEAIEKIDAALSRIGSALGSGYASSSSSSGSNYSSSSTFGSGGFGHKRRGRPKGSKNGNTPADSVGNSTSATDGRKKRTRKSFAISGDASILKFLEGNANATTKQINDHWSGEGRGGKPDNSLSKMVKEGKLKRTPLEGQRGSTYVVA